ncbi:GyrI-like domain-containing protein [Microbacterium sp. NPDC057659]|uniref:GyrI-like domain-containing protein n=1 Tax=Microbacterium sp. NPDC057659 TaxID=3346198 RepID=UPI00366B2593
MPAVDLKKQIESYRAVRGRFKVLTVPAMSFLMVDGHGDPNTAPEYRDAVGALYPLAYSLKFFSRRELGLDHTVMPLEALWSADDMDAFTSARDKSRWDWTVMIMVPDWITAEHVEIARNAARAKATAALDAVRFETYDEGLSVQTLHVGPYDAEGPVLDELHSRFIPENGLRMTGRHHEIYLGDPRRAAPEKLRTILRQPVERIG